MSRNQNHLNQLPQVPMNRDEELWLKAAYAKLKKGDRIFTTELLTELWELMASPKDFNYQKIDQRLFKYGSITLLGILQIDPSSYFKADTHETIMYIKRLIKNEPAIADVDSTKVSTAIEINKTDVENIFFLMTQMGAFSNGVTPNNHGGFASIHIGTENVRREYLGYDGINELLQRFNETDAPKQEPKIDSSLTKTGKTEVTDDKPISLGSADFSFVQNEGLAEIIKRDYAELQRLDPNKHIKSVLILSGGIIEAILLDALVSAKHWGLDEACERQLKEMIHPAKNMDIIKHDNITEVIRVFRNVIHAGREIREDISFDHSHAHHSQAAVDVIIGEVRKWRGKRGKN